MKILVVGTGYVGLVTGACFAEMGHTVTCLDIDEKKIHQLQHGDIPFYEPGLQELVLRHQGTKRLFFTTNYPLSIEDAEVIFLAVPTPSRDDGSCNTEFFFQAGKTIASLLRSDVVVVSKSTVPVGTTALLKTAIDTIIHQRKLDIQVDVVSNPEFLKEGAAVQDCLYPDRIIVGINTTHAEKIMHRLYKPYLERGTPIITMDLFSAELTKYASNAMLACRISFMNELSRLCDQLGADIHLIKQGMGVDKRIGMHFLNAGIGYGGSCFPKDIKALRSMASQCEVSTPLLSAIDTVNQEQKKYAVRKLASQFNELGGLGGKTIALWGLAFKPGTDDMREAPSLDIINELQRIGCKLQLFDPIATNNALDAIEDKRSLTFFNDPLLCATGADALCLLTEWPIFLHIDYNAVKAVMQGDIIFDGRNALDAEALRKIGFSYIGIGVKDEITWPKSQQYSLKQNSTWEIT